MQDREERVNPHFALIATVIVLVIVYGSLYPFHFRSNPHSSGPLRALIDTWRGPFGRGDFLANVLLYLPFGLFWIQGLPRLRPAARITVVVFSGMALSVCVELLQFYDEGRVSALADVYANSIGVIVGISAGSILFRRASSWRVGTVARRPFVILLLSCWLGYRLYPYVPVIDLHKYWTAVKPLAFWQVLPLTDLYRHFAIWLAVALLIEALFGTKRSRLLLPALVFIVLFGQILIVDAALSPADLGGGALAAVVWLAFLSRSQLRAPVIAVLFAGSVAIEALEPFQFNNMAHSLGWIHSGSFLRGSVDVNIRSFLGKVFTSGALVWLVARAGSPLKVAVGLGGGLVLCLALVQVLLTGQSTEIVDTIMVMVAGGAMKLMGDDPARITLTRAEDKGWRAAVYERLTKNDSVQPVDLIFVMAGRMERKYYGLELYRAGVAPRLVLSVGRYEVSKMSLADWEGIDELKSLRDQTPPDERHFFMTMDASGLRIERAKVLTCSTYGEVLAFQRFLEHQQVRSVMVVSTDVHLRRVGLTFASVFSGTAVRFLCCPVPARFGPMARDNWWRRPADRWFVINEMIKLDLYQIVLSAPKWAAHRLLLLTGWRRK